MFKLVVLSCLVSVAFAGIIPQVEYVAQVKNYVEPQVSVVETPTISHVGSVVKNVPTGVSHHSSSVVHSAANIVEPIYAHGVEKKIVSTPVVKNVVEHVQVAAPVVHAAPYVAKAVYAEPIVQKAVYAEAPVAYTSYAAAPVVKAAYAAPYATAYAAPYAAAYHPSAYSYSALPYSHHY